MYNRKQGKIVSAASKYTCRKLIEKFNKKKVFTLVYPLISDQEKDRRF